MPQVNGLIKEPHSELEAEHGQEAKENRTYYGSETQEDRSKKAEEGGPESQQSKRKRVDGEAEDSARTGRADHVCSRCGGRGLTVLFHHEAACWLWGPGGQDTRMRLSDHCCLYIWHAGGNSAVQYGNEPVGFCRHTTSHDGRPL